MKTIIGLLLLTLLSLSSLASEVKLLRAESTLGSVYGATWQNTKFLIKTQNGSRGQRVQVVFDDFIIEAKFVRALDQNFSLWQAEYQFANNPNAQGEARLPRDLDFYVERLDQNKSVRDDNHGENYQLARTEGSFLASDLNVMLGGETNLYSDGESKRFVGVVNVRNLAYAKNVRIVFSTDHWQTTQIAEAKFEAYYSYGYSTVISPNAKGIENWTFNVRLPVSAQGVEFAILYQVDGQEFWDNNFGQNYRL